MAMLPSQKHIFREIYMATWIPSSFLVEQEDEEGITLITPEGNIRVRQRKGDYRITGDGIVEILQGSRAEWIDPPPACKIKN